MSDLSITNVITVNLNEPQLGLNEYKVNNIAIFTKETPIASLTDGYAIYKNTTSVAEDWGTSSEVYLQAVAGFSQNPNILSGGGSLIVIPMLINQSASAGTFETPDIYSKIAALELIDDGEFDIAIDGAAAVHITGLDFDGVTTLTGLAAVIDTKLTGATCTANDLNGSLVFTSSSTGASSSIVITAYSGTGTDLTTIDYLDIADGTTVNGKAAGWNETLQEAIARTMTLVFYVGILATFDISSEMPALSNYVQTLRKLLFFPQDSTAALNPGGLFYNINSANNTHTRCLLYTLGAQDSRLMAAAYSFKGMSVNFDAANSTATQNLKDLTTILADTGITETIKFKCENLGVDIYPRISGISKVESFGANRYFDSIFNEIAFVGDLEIAGFNALATVSTKIPQTESGMTILKGAYRTICDQYVANRFISPGIWNSGDTFGDTAIFHENIVNFGYYIFSQPINQQSQADREARIAPVVQIAIKEAGAIHSSIINVYRNA